MAADAPTFSIVIPVHNEALYMPAAIDELLGELERLPVSFEVVIAENGSTDDTASVAERLAGEHDELSVLVLPDADYGAAMREGFLATGGAWAVNFDIDYFSGVFLEQVLELSDDADLVLASKRATGAEDRRSAFRRFATWTFNQILRFGLGSSVSDTHGMKAVRREVVTAVAPECRSTQDLFDTELVVRAERAGYRISEVPAVVEEKRQARTSLVKRVPRTLRGILSIRRSL